MDFTLERNVISDAELADLLSDCTDGSCPTSPDHDEEFAYDQLEIPFALPVKSDALPDSHLDFRPTAGVGDLGMSGTAAMPLFGADDGTGGPDFAKRLKREASPGSSSACEPAPSSAGTAAAAASAPATATAVPAAAAPAAASIPAATSSTDVAAADVAVATAEAAADVREAGSGGQRGVKRGAHAGGSTLQYKYPDLNEPGISAEELKRRRRETRLMKNRESANRSRLRRKKNLESLEIENGRLHAELRGARCQISALRELCGLLQRTLSSHDIPVVLPAELQAQLAPAPAPIGDDAAAAKAEQRPAPPAPPAPAPAPALVSPPTSPMSTDTYFDEETTLFRNVPMSERETAHTAALQHRARSRAGQQSAPQNVDAAPQSSAATTTTTTTTTTKSAHVGMLLLAICAAVWWAGGTRWLAAGAEAVLQTGFVSRVTEVVVANVITVVLTLLMAVGVGRKVLNDAPA